ncbi:MAG: hypothetical protein IKA85_08085 [Clostridia bacterium]|nr:hypothetical protein [Clostridia bacterium]
MYSLTKTKIKKFLVALLTFSLAIALALMTACGDTTTDDGDEDETETTTTETITDYQVVKNGDFEFATKEDTKYPYTSSINWTRSTDTDKNSATSSSVSSGIIDTSADAWAKLKDNEKPVDANGTAVNPGTPYSKGLITSTDYDYEDEDKRVNPQVDKSKILMINNKSSVDGLGSAQKFKSTSTISVPVDSYAIISLWVRTDNIKLKSGENGGAYVLITDRVGSTSYKNIEYRNINTNGEWKKIETVVKGSTFNSSSFSIAVGLGRGNGTFKADYVEGFAFFDNVEAKVYSASEYKALNRTDAFVNVSKDAGNFNEYVAPTTNNTLSYAYSYEYVKDADVTNLTPVANETIGYNTANINPSRNYDLSTGNEISKAKANAVTNQTIKTAIEDLKDTGLPSDASIIYFDFARESTGFYTTDKVVINEKGRHYITFYAKTNVSNEKIKMAKVALINTTTGEETTTIAGFDSFTTTTVEDSAYGEWVKYSILVNNPTDTATDYKLKFVFGDDETPLIDDVYKLQKGYAIFAGLNVETISEENYDLVSTGNTVKKLSVYGKYSNYTEEGSESEVKDTYSISPDQYGKFEIVNNPTSYIPNFTLKGNKADVKAGIVNSKYNDNYTFLNVGEKQSFANLKETTNKYAQLILFKNETTVGTSQLLSSRRTITENSVSVISLKLRVLGDAVAKVRLVENTPNSDGSYKTLTLDAGEWQKELSTTVTRDSFLLNNWTEVRFYVASGNEQINFRVEISLEKAGTLFVHSLTDDLSLFESVDALDKEIEVLEKEFEEINLELSQPLMHTRAPAKVLSTDEDGNDVESTRTFEPTEIYTTNGLYTFAKFHTIFVENEIDERTQEDTDTDEDTTTEEDGYKVTTDLSLQISSLVLALVLVVVLIVVIIKNTKKKTATRKEVVESYYDRKTRDEAMAKIAKKKAQIDVSNDDEVKEYDYEEAELVNEEETITEEVVEEKAEETTETSEEVTETVIKVEEEKTEEVVEETTEENKEKPSENN